MGGAYLRTVREIMIGREGFTIEEMPRPQLCYMGLMEHLSSTATI